MTEEDIILKRLLYKERPQLRTLLSKSIEIEQADYSKLTPGEK